MGAHFQHMKLPSLVFTHGKHFAVVFVSEMFILQKTKSTKYKKKEEIILFESQPLYVSEHWTPLQ